MSAKLNIFAALPQHFSDSEDEVDNKKQTKNTKNAAGNKPGEHIKGGKDHHHKKVKGAPEVGTHTSERQSGTGQPAFDKKSAKKGGAGKGNWGSYKDRKEDRTGEGEETQEETPESQQPTGITLEEYLAKTKLAKNEPQINEAKAKITSEQLMKEVLQGKATILAPKNKDDKEKPQPKKKVNVDEETHVVSGVQQYADLLNFRTGFVEREFGKKRSEADAPREKRERPAEKEPAAEQETPAEDKPEAEKRQERPRGDNKEKRGGFKKGSFKGNKEGGNHRGGNYRKNYQPQPKINIEDDSAFPKLG